MKTFEELLGKTNDELAHVDPLVMNLLVAKSIPGLAQLEVEFYRELAGQWAEAFARTLPGAEEVFWETPWEWKNDVNFFRLGQLCCFLINELGIQYNEHQRERSLGIAYTDPCDLFLNGVMDRRRGTCANMATLYVALGWRMGWPVSLACVKSHFICRYDDGKVQHNIETTHPSTGAFKSDPDEFIIREEGLTPKAISTGSDLRAVKPRELLGLFLGLKGRHLRDIGEKAEAEKSYLLARYLFPSNHNLYFTAMGVSVMRGEEMFSVDEEGHPLDLASWIVRWYADSHDLRGVNLPFHMVTPVEPLTEATRMTDSLFTDVAFGEREGQ